MPQNWHGDKIHLAGLWRLQERSFRIEGIQERIEEQSLPTIIMQAFDNWKLHRVSHVRRDHGGWRMLQPQYPREYN